MITFSRWRKLPVSVRPVCALIRGSPRQETDHHQHRLQWAATGVRSCLEKEECVRERLRIPSGENYEICHSVHAEANAIIRADFESMDDSTLYIFGVQQEKPRSGMPCFMCWRMIFNAGIGKVVFLDERGEKKIVNVKVIDRGRILSYAAQEP